MQCDVLDDALGVAMCDGVVLVLECGEVEIVVGE